jgi:hypothetical protein
MGENSPGLVPWQPSSSEGLVISTLAFTTSNRGRCYDQSYLRFSTIFGQKIGGFFFKSQCYDFLHNLALFGVKNANFFAEFFGENV